MKHKRLLLLLVCVLCIGLTLPAAAASFGRSRYNFSNMTFTQNTTYKDSFVACNNFTVRSGVQVTFARYAAIEIYGDMILEKGASLTAVDNTAFFSIGHEGSVQGLDLYFRCRFSDGSEELHKLPPVSEIYAKTDVWSQENPEFHYDSASGCWVMDGAIQAGVIPESDEALFGKHDITLSGKKTYTSGLDNYYRNFTVASGADVTLNIITRDIRVTGKLTIPKGASLKGFTTLTLMRDAKYDAPLYVMMDDKPEPLTYSISELLDFGMGDDMVSFKYDGRLGGWVTKDTLHRADIEGQNEAPGGEPDAEQRKPHGEAAMSAAMNSATQLNYLNLFRGIGTLPDGKPNYDLAREGNRIEALIMLIRLLGKEETALSGSWEHPFTDVPEWADKYVGYAYEAGLTKGISDSQFGTGKATAQQFLTFLLRALGYTGDDTWTNAFELARGCGVYEDDDLQFMPPKLSFDPFWRADMALLARRALDSNGNRSHQLAAELVGQGVFTQEAWESLHESRIG